MSSSCETILARLPDSSMGEQDVQTTGNRMRSYLVNIGQVWSPEYIPRSNPIMSCCLIVPGTLRALSPDLNPQAGGLVELMLTHYSKYWKLGTRGLGKQTPVDTRSTNSDDIFLNSAPERHKTRQTSKTG